MRFVPVNCIRNGMICGKKLFGKSGELLLNAGAVIYEVYIESIKELGYSGVYVDDDLSKDIEIMEVINSDLRIKAVSTVKNAFISFDKNNGITNESANELQQMMGNIVDDIMSSNDFMVNMIDVKVFDDYTFYHSVNVGVLSIIIGTALGLKKDQLHTLGIAGLLHDIGKVFISKELLNKPGKLSFEEYEVMKTHSFKGYDYLKTIPNIPSTAYVGVLQHHERYDGTGYPNGTSGSNISLFGRIIAIADVYDALVSNRPYRQSLIPSDAAEFIMGGGSSVFDPHIVDSFIKKIAIYPKGTYVMLSDGRSGIVAENYSDCCVRPKVKIVKHKELDIKPYYLDLRNDRSTLSTTIVGISDIS